MLILTYKMMMICTLTITLIMMATLLTKKLPLSKEKNSPFKCGFEPMESARLPFSIHFFVIGILFLIFDVEIMLIIPLLMTSALINMKSLLISTFLLTFILLWGLMHEWNYKSLDWTR